MVIPETSASAGHGDKDQSKAPSIMDALTTLSDALAASTASTQGDLGRLDSVVREATKELVLSFETLTETTRRQNASHARLMAELSGGGDENHLDLQEFVEGMRTVLSEFGDVIGSYSMETMRINGKVLEVLEHMQEMKAMLVEIDSIADDTNMLAINAALEAARAGEYGKGFQVVSTEIRHLAKKTKRIDGEVNDRVERTSALSLQAQRALKVLVTTDLSALATARGEVERMADRLTELEVEINRALGDSEGFASTVQGAAMGAVRAMQFEDIVTQVVATLIKRIGLIPEKLQAEVAQLPTNPTAEDIVGCLNRALEVPGVRMPAQQEILDEGDVTLF